MLLSSGALLSGCRFHNQIMRSLRIISQSENAHKRQMLFIVKKKTSVIVNEELEVAVREKGMRLRLFDWQSCAERALSEWVKPSSALGSESTPPPPGMQAIYVPADLPEQFVQLLTESGEALADAYRVDEELDRLGMELKKAKLKKIG